MSETKSVQLCNNEELEALLLLTINVFCRSLSDDFECNTSLPKEQIVKIIFPVADQYRRLTWGDILVQFYPRQTRVTVEQALQSGELDLPTLSYIFRKCMEEYLVR